MNNHTQEHALPIPDMALDTPAFVISMEAVDHNLDRTIAAIGGVERLVPHVKTHRAPWLVRHQIKRGVRAFKTATPLEVEMVLEAGAPEVVWAYPTVNPSAIARVIAAAEKHPEARVVGMVDSHAGLDAWMAQLADPSAPDVRLRVDLDPGMGRTGAPLSDETLDLARALVQTGRFEGWHVYDGHVQDPDRDVRQQRVGEIRSRVKALVDRIRAESGVGDLIAGGSYSFDLWPVEEADRVSPGSWIYSSAQHQSDLAHAGWEVGAYVVTTVLSTRNGTATLDAGAKAISPDKPLNTRFAGDGVRIRSMNEEHTIVEAEGLNVGDRIAIVPQHACTTAYLYPRALVHTREGQWEVREQLGSAR